MKKTITAFTLVCLAAALCGCVNSADWNRPSEYSDTQFLMDTVCTIRAGGDNAETAVRAAFDRIAEIAVKTDYFSDTSEVSAINRAEANEAISVSADTETIIRTALEISEKTQGEFDITVAPVKDLWNFGGGDHRPPAPDEVSSALRHVGYQKISIDGHSVTKTASDTKIDLGAAAKGYAADAAKEIMTRYGVPYGLIDLGGNILCFGKNPARGDGKWLIGIQKPFGGSGEYTQTVTADNTAVVTSGTYQRFFTWNGTQYHHIIDPKSGYPADSGISGASVVCDSALAADCLSTACMVMGKEKSQALADDMGFRLICE